MLKIKEFIIKNLDDIIKPVAVLLAICIIIPLALSVTNKVTADRIVELADKSSNETMARLIKADQFEEKKFSAKDTEFSYHIALKEGKAVGYIFSTKAKGYGGDVSVMTAIDTFGEIKNVAILDVTSETPGLGQNTAKEAFYSQYKGKKSEVSLLKSGANKDKNEVDAVTGATVSSKAVNEAVNTAIHNFNRATTMYSINNEAEEGNDEK